MIACGTGRQHAVTSIEVAPITFSTGADRERLTLSPRGVCQDRLRRRDQLRHHAVELVDDRVSGEAEGS